MIILTYTRLAAAILLLLAFVSAATILRIDMETAAWEHDCRINGGAVMKTMKGERCMLGGLT